MITLNVDLYGLDDVTRRLFLVSEEMEQKVPSALSRVARRGAEAVAGGAPVDTGEYLGSIGYDGPNKTGDGWEARIGTGKPYGRRLELGYVGPDSAGRTFHHLSIPAPHFGPVAAEIGGWLVAELRG